MRRRGRRGRRGPNARQMVGFGADLAPKLMNYEFHPVSEKDANRPKSPELRESHSALNTALNDQLYVR